MSLNKSFYDLDYIIEINEKRVEQNTTAYYKVFDKLPHLILIYSALTIFLVTLFQEAFLSEKGNWVLYVCFAAFAGCTLTSIVFALLMMIPEDVAYLGPPSIFYTESREAFEIEKQLFEQETRKKTVDEMLKVLYIDELEGVAELNMNVFQKKSKYYVWAFRFALIAVVPYLICLGFHFSKKEESIQKVQIVNSAKNAKLHQTDTMSENNNSTINQEKTKPQPGQTDSVTKNIKTTRFPGVADSLVRPAKIHTVKEGSTKVKTKIR